jgi:hypothetical protein
MPHANVWIRKEDWEKWQALDSKSEFIHFALNPEKYQYKTTYQKAAEDFNAEVVDNARKIKNNTQNPVGEAKPTRNSAGFCANGHPIPDGRSKCMGKGCKYS